MDKQRTHQPDEGSRITCPKCGEAQTVRPISVLRPGDENLESLFKGTLNRAACTACGAPFVLDLPLVFRDDDGGLVICLIQIEDSKKWGKAERQMKQILDSLLEQNPGLELPACRLCTTRKSFIEKISLHLRQLDDRIVEYVKYQLYQNREQKLDPVRSELLFDFSNPDDGRLAFLVFDRESGRPVAGAHVPMDVYTEIADMFLQEAPLKGELEQLFPGCFVSVERLL